MMMFPCGYNASEVVAKINGYTYVGDGDENQMVLANHHLRCSWSCASISLSHSLTQANFVAKLGPISVCLNAPPSWSSYTGTDRHKEAVCGGWL